MVGEAPAVSGARRVVVGGKGKGKGTTARPGQVVLGVAPYPPSHPPLAFSGRLRVVVGGKGKGKGTSAGPTQVVLGVAHRPPPCQGTRGAGRAPRGRSPGLAPTVVVVAAPGAWNPGLAPTVVVAEGRRTKEG